MSAKRALLLVVGLILVAGLLAGCAARTETATFIGYKQRPADANSPGVAIVQLNSGQPAEATCKYSTLENGDPIKVTKTGKGYKVVSVSPCCGRCLHSRSTANACRLDREAVECVSVLMASSW